MSKPTAWEVVQTARSLERPTSQYFIRNIFDDFVELHGDKLFADDAAIIGGIGRLRGTPVTVIGQEKGVSLSEKARCNFGAANPEGYRKSLRLMRQAEKFGRPVICIVDTQGAFCGVGAEERGMGEAIARSMFEMSRLRVPIISVLIGEGGSGGAIALAISDRVAMLENSVYSILSPEGFASILWKDASRAPEAAQLMRMAAPEVHAMGLVDDIIAEPPGGANASDDGAFAKVVEEYIANTLNTLQSQPISDLVSARYDKFRHMGNEHLSEEPFPGSAGNSALTEKGDPEKEDKADQSAEKTKEISIQSVSSAEGESAAEQSSAKHEHPGGTEVPNATASAEREHSQSSNAAHEAHVSAMSKSEPQLDTSEDSSQAASPNDEPAASRSQAVTYTAGTATPSTETASPVESSDVKGAASEEASASEQAQPRQRKGTRKPRKGSKRKKK